MSSEFAAIYERLAASHRNCVVCGEDSGAGCHLRLRPLAAGRVVGNWHPDPAWRSYEGILHGGIAAALLDAVMVHALFSLGIRAVTAGMELRYHRPVHLDAAVTLEGWRVRSKLGLHLMEATLQQDGQLSVHATARFMESPEISPPSSSSEMQTSP